MHTAVHTLAAGNGSICAPLRRYLSVRVRMMTFGFFLCFCRSFAISFCLLLSPLSLFVSFCPSFFLYSTNYGALRTHGLPGDDKGTAITRRKLPTDTLLVSLRTLQGSIASWRRNSRKGLGAGPDGHWACNAREEGPPPMHDSMQKRIAGGCRVQKTQKMGRLQVPRARKRNKSKRKKGAQH